MKKLILSIGLMILFTACKDPNEKFTGYLVAKEYTPAHMSNEKSKTVTFSSFAYVPTVPIHPSSSKPRKISEKWVWYIANKREVIQKQVSKKLFYSKKCGDKITIKRYK